MLGVVKLLLGHSRSFKVIQNYTMSMVCVRSYYVIQCMPKYVYLVPLLTYSALNTNKICMYEY